MEQVERHMKEAVNKIQEVGALYATAKGISYQLQEQRKIVLAKVACSLEGSAAARELEARASERYSEHVKAAGLAIEEEQRLKAEYTRWQAQYEACRSLVSFEKAKANIR